MVKSPKAYVVDTGLAGYLLELDEARLTADPSLRGSLLETFVVSEITRELGWSQRRPRLYHFRQNTGQEVDLVLEDPSAALVGIEVKASAAVTGQDFRGLRALAEIAGPRFRRGIVLYTGEATVAFGENLYALPLSSLWAGPPLEPPSPRGSTT